MLLEKPCLLFISEKVQSDLLHKYQSRDDILILTVRLAVIVAVILTVPVLFFTVSKEPCGHRRNTGLGTFILTTGSCFQRRSATGGFSGPRLVPWPKSLPLKQQVGSIR